MLQLGVVYGHLYVHTVLPARLWCLSHACDCDPFEQAYTSVVFAFCRSHFQRRHLLIVEFSYVGCTDIDLEGCEDANFSCGLLFPILTNHGRSTPLEPSFRFAMYITPCTEDFELYILSPFFLSMVSASKYNPTHNYSYMCKTVPSPLR